MSNSDVQVKFSASVGAVNSAIADVKTSLQGLGAHAKTANDNLKGIGTTAKNEFGIAGGAITDLRYVLEGIVDPIRGIRKNLGELADAFIAAFAVEEIGHFVEDMGKLGEETVRTMHILGMSAPQVTELNYIARATGTSTQALAMGVERFQRNLAQAMTGVGPAASALHNFGLNARDLINLPLDEQLNKFADAVSNYADGGTKLANGQALMSRAFANMLPVLDQGSAGLDKLRADARQTGDILSNSLAEAFAGTQEHIVAMNSALSGLGQRIFSVVEPSIDALIVKFTSLVESLNANTIRASVIEIVQTVGSAIKALGDFAIGLSGLFGNTIRSIDDLKTRIYGLGGGALVGLAAGGPIGAIGGAIVGNVLGDASVNIANRLGSKSSGPSPEQLTARFNASIDSMTRGLNNLVASTKGPSNIFGHVFDGAMQTKPQAAPLNTMFGHHHAAHSGASKAARDAVTVSLDGLNREMQAIQANTRAKLTAYSSDVKNKTMTEDQKVSLTLAALAAELQAEQSLLNKEMALGGLSVSQKQAILNKKQQLEEAYAAAVAKIKQEAVAVEQKNAEATTKAWQKTWNTINNAFTGQISSLLKGTETFGQAFKNILAGMITDVIKFLVKWALQHAETILQNVAMTAMGATAQKAINMTTIQGDAAKAGAGAYSAVTGIPIIGPILAPAAAAVAYAGTMAFASLDKGSLNLPGDQMAMVHAGETIIPPGPSADFRSIIGNLGAAVNNGGSRSGGDNHTHVHFNVNANDAGSVSSYFKSHSRQILEAINHGVRTGNHLGLSHIGG